VDEGSVDSPVSVALNSPRRSTVGPGGNVTYTDPGNSFFTFATSQTAPHLIEVTSPTTDVSWDLHAQSNYADSPLGGGACDNDVNGTGVPGPEECITPILTGSANYYLRVHNYDGTGTYYTLSIWEPDLFDNFEDGLFTDQWFNPGVTGSGTYIASVDTIGANGTSRSLTLTGGDDNTFYNGRRADLGSGHSTSRIVYYVRSGATTNADGCFAINATDGKTAILLCLENDGTFIVFNSDNANNFTTFGSYSANTWYKVEFREINWSAKTYDLYIDDNLIQSGITFYNTGATNVRYINLFNYNTGSQAWWDEIMLFP